MPAVVRPATERDPTPSGRDRPYSCLAPEAGSRSAAITLKLLELGLQLAVLALEKHDAPPLGHEILGHLAQRAPNPLGSDLLHVA